MRKITLTDANSLREDGAAGFYATWANPPIMHPQDIYIVQIGEDFYLTETGDMGISEAGVVVLESGLPKMAHAVTVSNEELAGMIMKDLRRGKPIELGAGVPSFHTDILKPN